MLTSSLFDHKPIAVLGLGKSGLAASKRLQDADIDVWAWDEHPDRRAQAKEQGITLIDLHHQPLDPVAALVLSPGIAHLGSQSHPVARRAKEGQIEIISDIEILGRAYPDRPFLGVTGTNGKSTTTSLIGHLMTKAGYRVSVGGNIGIPALSLCDPGPQGWYVLELSSFQLERISTLRFDIAILLNITPDHLDRHGSMVAYIEAKRRIFAPSLGPQIAIIGIDDPYCHQLRDDLVAAHHWHVIPISMQETVSNGIRVCGHHLIDARTIDDRISIDLSDIPTLPGRHHWQDAAAAYGAAVAVGIPPSIAEAGLRSFPGLRHRLNTVDTIAGIRYINDSKATNTDSAALALSCFDTIYWIAGGLAKTDNLGKIEQYLTHVCRAYLIGTAAKIFAQCLEGSVDYVICETLEQAFKDATRDAHSEKHPNPCIVLAPGCASFDQFTDFEERGEAFVQLVKTLKDTGIK